MKLETLQKWKEGATIFALIAVPIIVAFGPPILQNRIAEESVRKDYVALAIGLLTKTKGEKPDDQLRKWAVDVLNKNSPVPMSGSLKSNLQAGASSLTWALGRPVDGSDPLADARAKEFLELLKKDWEKPPEKK